jgi:Na+-translocating ferredoxin:NAD+ oxidoreductase subunit C
MDVNHKTFVGGYRFGIFEGQPSKKIVPFKSSKNSGQNPLKLEGEQTATNVLNALGKTAFSGPANALVSVQGTINPNQVKDIIVNFVEVEPYNLSHEVILGGTNALKFVKGLSSIHTSFKDAKITLVFGDNQDAFALKMKQEISSISSEKWLHFSTITAKYPANLKEISIPAVLGKNYPVGYSPAQIGVLYLTVMDVLCVSRVTDEKKALDSTYIALAGPGWKENLILEVPIGTPLSELKSKYLAEGEVRLIKNSALNEGVFSDDAVIGFDTSIIIALPEDRQRQTLFFLRSGLKADSFTRSFLSSLLPKAAKVTNTRVNGERRACVSCTFCQEVCPVGLLPHLLHKHVDKKIITKRLAEYRIFDCVECGLCDYVCPSKIEISSDIKRGKAMLEANQLSHNQYVIPKCEMINEVKNEATHAEGGDTL